MHKRTVALIVAAGQGTRLSSELPKQYMRLGDKEILRITLERFLAIKAIDAVAVAIHPNHIDLYQKAISGLNLLPHIIGGESRQQSAYNALNELVGFDNILIHDACRPFVETSVIEEVIRLLETENSITAATHIADSLCSVSNEYIQATIPRENLYAIQTPQGFDFKALHSLHIKYKNEHFTDDTGFFTKEGIKTKIVLSSTRNLKITTEGDLALAIEMFVNMV